MDLSQTGDKWTKKVDLPENARVEYKLIVDGNWIVDPANPRRMNNGIGGENSVWQGPKYKFSCQDGQPKQPLIRSTIQVGGREIVVYSPSKPAGLPILFLGDGPMYESAGKVQNIVQNLVEAHKIRPVVIALIPPIDRMKEYGTDWKAYGEYSLTQVLPAVNKVTGAGQRPSDVFMGGSSMGGLISLRLAEEFPERLAGGILCQSAAVQWKALNIRFDDATSQERLKKIAPSARISLDWGMFESTLSESNVKLAKNLSQMQRRYKSTITPEGHTWTAWRNRMEAGLIYLFGNRKS